MTREEKKKLLKIEKLHKKFTEQFAIIHSVNSIIKLKKRNPSTLTIDSSLYKAKAKSEYNLEIIRKKLEKKYKKLLGEHNG